jgi:quinol---cytochrome c reductase iron-sulfur subunit, bacillus type
MQPAPRSVAQTPDPARATDGGRFTRRAFVVRVLAGVSAALAAALAVPVAGLAAGPALKSRIRWPFLGGSIPPTPRATGWRSIGPVSGFEVGVPTFITVTLPVNVQGATEPTPVAVYVVRPDQDSVLILDLHCTHMGCPVSWSQGAKRYLCPCHGGAFAADGTRVVGPPPRRLDRYQALVANQVVWMGPLIEPD